jgi:hypothetical protein
MYALSELNYSSSVRVSVYDTAALVDRTNSKIIYSFALIILAACLNNHGIFDLIILLITGTRQRSFLRQFVTSRKLAVSSPDEVIGF